MGKRIYRIGKLRFVFVEDEVEFDIDGRERIRLSEERGWWIVRDDDTMEVWVWGRMSLVERIRTIVHEIVELLLEGRIGLSHSVSHRIASVAEFLVSIPCLFLVFLEWLKMGFFDYKICKRREV
jgi:hypothetical protein